MAHWRSVVCKLLLSSALVFATPTLTAAVGKPTDATQAGVVGDGTLKNLDVQLKDGKLRADDAKNLKFEDVTVNGKPFSL